MDYDALSRQIGNKLRTADDAARYRFGACLLQDNPYGWGQEHLISTDCSGSVAIGLLFAGYNVRLTADAYYRMVFTGRPAVIFDPGEICAVFYIATTDRTHGDRKAKKGEVVHVTPVIGDGCILDAAWGKPARIRTTAKAAVLHKGFGTTPVLCSADWTKLITLNESGKYPVDDAELLELVAKG